MGKVWVVSKRQGMRYVSMSLVGTLAMKAAAIVCRLRTLYFGWHLYDTLSMHLLDFLLPRRHQALATVRVRAQRDCLL